MSRIDIAAEGAGLEPGESARMVCPFCGGGTSGERSLSIKRDHETGLILYHCFRGNCGEAGVLGGTRSLVRTTKEPKKFEPWDASALVLLSRGTDVVPAGVYRQLEEWGLGSAAGLTWSYDPRDDRICMPILGPLGDLRGYVRRAYRQGAYVKALMGRVDDKHPMVHYDYPDGEPRSPSHLVCVEDIPSATRLARKGLHVVALLGCTPSEEVLSELGMVARNRMQTVVFALDADATTQAIRLVRTYGMRGLAYAATLHKDVKNMTPEELESWLMNAI